MVKAGAWTEVVLAGTGARPDAAPRTLRLLRECASDEVLSLANGNDGAAGEVIFSVLAPHTVIQPHTASHNLRLTAHLALRVPSSSGGAGAGDCYLRVADQPRMHWETGRDARF